ncbi:MAG: hypothetical protein WBD22_13705, partial [Pyrinomonadaceae bacterium]
MVTEAFPDIFNAPLTDVPGRHSASFNIESLTRSTIEPIVRRRLHISLRPDDTCRKNQDGLDIVSEARVLLLSELQKNVGVNGVGIRDVSGYAATITVNACNQYFRSRFPLRTREMNKLRYLVTHNRRFALWKDDANRSICGFAQWRSSAIRANTIPGDTVISVDRDNEQNERKLYFRMLDQLFDTIDAPLRLEDLTDWIMKTRGIVDNEPIVIGDDEATGGLKDLSDNSQPIDRKLETAQQLRILWERISELSPPQCAALLLNLKDNRGDGIIAALPLTRTASLLEIAAAVDIPVEEFAGIWNTLH